jgi:chorismate mutase-like protein
MNQELERLRTHINQIDEKLLKLISDRAETARAIGKVKTAEGLPIYVPERERMVLEQLTALNQGPLDKGAVEEIFATIMTVCRELQSR